MSLLRGNKNTRAAVRGSWVVTETVSDTASTAPIDQDDVAHILTEFSNILVIKQNEFQLFFKRRLNNISTIQHYTTRFELAREDASNSE